MVAEHITSLPSDKHSGARSRTQMLVVHSAETPLLSGYAASVTTNWLNKMYQASGALIEASINTFFGPDTTVRSVHTDCAAWHASWANAVSIGYEFTGYAALSREQWLTDAGKAMLDRAGREMAADAALYGIPLRWLTTAEVNAIRAGDTTIKGLATHRQIDPGSRTDPGDGFPYDVLLSTINHYAGNGPTIQEDDMPLNTDDKQWIGNKIYEILQDKNVLEKLRAAIINHTSLVNIQGTTLPILSKMAGQMAGLQEAVAQLSKATGAPVDLTAVEAASKRGAAAALKEGVNIDVTVGGTK